MPKKKEPTRMSDLAPSQPLAVQVRGTPQWKEWVEELAEFARMPVSGIVDTALAQFAIILGFRPPPKR